MKILYILFYTFLGAITVFEGFILWGLNRLLTKLRHPPIFHGATLFYTISEAPFKGTFYASVPYVLALTLVFHWFATPNQQYPRSEVTPPQLNSMEQTTTYMERAGRRTRQPGAYRGVLTCRGAFTSLMDSWPSHDAGGGFFFEFELFRTASGPSRRVQRVDERRHETVVIP